MSAVSNGILPNKLVHLCVCLGVCRMDESDRYIWDFDLFLILWILTLMGGMSMILEVGGYPSSQMQAILHMFRVMPKYIYLDCDLIMYYFDHFII